MKQGLALSALALLAVPQAAQAQSGNALCDMLAAYAASQWSEAGDPAPRHWVEFRWGYESNSTNRWSWGCSYSGDDASERFCDWLMANTSQQFHIGLPLNLLRCAGDGTQEQGAATLLLQGKVRREEGDGSYLVLESASDPLRPSASAVRISFDSDDRKLDPEVLPPLEAFQPAEDGAVTSQ